MWHAVTLQLSNSPELPPMHQETKVSIHHQHKPRQMHLEFTYSMTKFKSTRRASILATSVSLRSRPYLFWTCFSSKFPAKQDLLACVGVIAGKCRDSICLKLMFFRRSFFPPRQAWNDTRNHMSSCPSSPGIATQSCNALACGPMVQDGPNHPDLAWLVWIANP